MTSFIYTQPTSRVIFVNNLLGRRQFKETLGNLLIGLVVSRDDIWLVSPWVTDFEVLDNRSGDWDSIESSWSLRKINFSEVLIKIVESGSRLTLVTNNEPINNAFIKRIHASIPDNNNFKNIKSEELHTKGLLTKSFFLSGSMNFTYSGAQKNEEQIQLTIDPDIILEARLEFENTYEKITK